MKIKCLFFLAGMITLLVSCAVPQVVVQEGGQTVIQLEGARFTVPPGFHIVDVIENNPFEEYSESMVIMGKFENGNYSVIVFSAQRAEPEIEFLKMNLSENYADAIFIDEEIGFLYHAVSYITNMPMARKVYLEKPLCKVVSGYQYYGTFKRFRFDIYQNLADQDPLQLVFAKGKPLSRERALNAREREAAREELLVFRDTAFDIIKNYTRWP